jgi:hypothetical protein
MVSKTLIGDTFSICQTPSALKTHPITRAAPCERSSETPFVKVDSGLDDLAVESGPLSACIGFPDRAVSPGAAFYF